MEVKTGVNTEKTAECQPETSPCIKKMLKLMRFSLSMEDAELDVLKEPPNPQPEQKEEDIEDDGFNDYDVFCSLTTMSLNLMDDQESDNPLICNESDIVSDTANISYISEQIYTVINKQRNFMKTQTGCKYVASKQNKICLENTMSAKITIFSGILGMVTHENSGVPVMLNFTGTNNYLCCRKEEDIILTVTVYDKKNDHLFADDPKKSLIFYMSQKCDGLRFFESALHRGWFIHTVNDDTVKMKKDKTGFFFE